MRFPLQGVVHLETSHIPSNDRFAAQIVYAADPSSVAPQGEGGCPPMYRLVTDCRSFHFQFPRFEIVHAIAGSGLRDGKRTNFTPRFRSSS